MDAVNSVDKLANKAIIINMFAAFIVVFIVVVNISYLYKYSYHKTPTYKTVRFNHTAYIHQRLRHKLKLIQSTLKKINTTPGVIILALSLLVIGFQLAHQFLLPKKGR